MRRTGKKNGGPVYCSNPKCDSSSVYRDGLCEDCYKEKRIREARQRITRERAALSPAKDLRQVQAAYDQLLQEKAQLGDFSPAPVPIREKRPKRKAKPKAASASQEAAPIEEPKPAPTAPCEVTDCQEQAAEDNLCKKCLWAWDAWRMFRQDPHRCPIKITDAQISLFELRFRERFPDQVEPDPPVCAFTTCKKAGTINGLCPECDLAYHEWVSHRGKNGPRPSQLTTDQVWFFRGWFARTKAATPGDAS